MTIDVALLRQLAAWPNTSLVAHGPVVLLKPTTVTELLDAYEERERLREILERLRTRMAEPQQPIIQWDAGTWIERIDAALEGRE